jgi:hypothetical protein
LKIAVTAGTDALADTRVGCMRESAAACVRNKELMDGRDLLDPLSDVFGGARIHME